MTNPVYIRVPFGTSGDRTAIPVAGAAAGPVNYTYGWGTDYSLPRSTNPAALNVERVAMNEVLYDITSNIQQYQQYGFPWFITTSDNGGSPFSYSANAAVRYDTGSGIYVYISLIDANTELPTNALAWKKLDVAAIGTVTSASVASANGFAGTVANATTTPVITISTSVTGLMKGNGTAVSAATVGTDYSAGTSGLATGIIKSTTGTGAFTIAVAADFPTLNQNTTGSAATLTTARTIGGVSFDGSANITVATATGGFTVSGGNLAVGANDITCTGSLGATGARLTKGWFTDLQVTNAIAGSITGNAATVTTNANLTGVITSSGNATSIASQTGTGTKFVVDTSPTLVTPILGEATATSINKVAITAPATSATLTIANGKTLTASNTLTFTGTDSSSVAFGAGGTVSYRELYTLGGVAGAGGTIGTGIVIGTTTARIWIPFKFRLTTAPTGVSVANVGNFAVYNNSGGGATTVLTALTFVSGDLDGITLLATVGSAVLTVGQSTLLIDTNANAVITLTGGAI